MMVIFDGREFAKKKEQELRIKTQDLRGRGIIPKLATILVGDDPASHLYVSLKKKAAERIGARLEVISLSQSIEPNKIINSIKGLNEDETVHGIMVQLPLPSSLKPKAKSIINTIDLKKDVDGLRENSLFIPATVKAILQILTEALKIVRPPLRGNPCKVVVIGAGGEVGRRLMNVIKKDLRFKNLEIEGYDIETVDIRAKTKGSDILISATGVPGLIKGDMVKDGVIVIDVGSPKGDFDFESISKKASFITPVPGGVGPFTISCLLQNLVDSVSN